MRCYNINIIKDTNDDDYKYQAVIGVYDDGINTMGCYLAESTFNKLLDKSKQAVLRYDKEITSDP